MGSGALIDAAVGSKPPAGQRAGALAHILLRVAVAMTEREQLHELPGQVLIGRRGGILLPIQPEQHRGIGKHRHGQTAEVAATGPPERLVLPGQPPGPTHLGGRSRKVVMPKKGQLLAERFLDGHHAADPPRRQVRQLAANLLITLLPLVLRCTPVQRPNRVEGRDRSTSRAGVGRWIGSKNGRNVIAEADPIRHVDRRASCAEPGATEQARGCPPVSRLHGAEPAPQLFGSGEDGANHR